MGCLKAVGSVCKLRVARHLLQETRGDSVCHILLLKSARLYVDPICLPGSSVETGCRKNIGHHFASSNKATAARTRMLISGDLCEERDHER